MEVLVVLVFALLTLGIYGHCQRDDDGAVVLSVPESVHALRISICGVGMTTIRDEIEASPGETTMAYLDVPAGRERFLLVEGLDDAMCVVSNGWTIVDVSPGASASIGIELQPIGTQERIVPIAVGIPGRFDLPPPSIRMYRDGVLVNNEFTVVGTTSPVHLSAVLQNVDFPSSYEWDFDGDGTYDWASELGPDVDHVFDEGATYGGRASLRVTSEDGTRHLSQPLHTRVGNRVLVVIDVGDRRKYEVWDFDVGNHPRDLILSIPRYQVPSTGSFHLSTDGHISISPTDGVMERGEYFSLRATMEHDSGPPYVDEFFGNWGTVHFTMDVEYPTPPPVSCRIADRPDLRGTRRKGSHVACFRQCDLVQGRGGSSI